MWPYSFQVSTNVMCHDLWHSKSGSFISHLNVFSSILFNTFTKWGQSSSRLNADLELWACGLVTIQSVAEGVNTSHELKPTITLYKLPCSVLIKWLPLGCFSCWATAGISRFRLNTVVSPGNGTRMRYYSHGEQTPQSGYPIESSLNFVIQVPPVTVQEARGC
jgi:hypothetical protein